VALAQFPTGSLALRANEANGKKAFYGCIGSRRKGFGLVGLRIDVDKLPDPHPALRATFSQWEKENRATFSRREKKIA